MIGMQLPPGARPITPRRINPQLQVPPMQPPMQPQSNVNYDPMLLELAQQSQQVPGIYKKQFADWTEDFRWSDPYGSGAGDRMVADQATNMMSAAAQQQQALARLRADIMGRKQSQGTQNWQQWWLLKQYEEGKKQEKIDKAEAKQTRIDDQNAINRQLHHQRVRPGVTGGTTGRRGGGANIQFMPSPFNRKSGVPQNAPTTYHSLEDPAAAARRRAKRDAEQRKRKVTGTVKNWARGRYN